jgi:tetratricopeptide (TPR) repeat protein
MSSHLRLVAACFVVLTAALQWGCTRTPKEREARYLEAGKRRMESKDYNRAILEFRNATIVMPKDSEAFYQLGTAYLMRGDFRSAGLALKKATDLNPKNNAAMVKYAELLALSGDPELAKEGRDRMQDILNASPGNADALTALALADLRFGDQKAGEEHLREALRNVPEKLQSSMILARVKIETGDLDGAGEVLRDAVQHNPNSSEAALGMAAYYKLRKKWPEAESEYRRAQKLDPKDPRCLNGIATVQVQSGRKDKAEATYRELAALAGNNPYRHYHAAFQFQEGKRDEAIAEFVKLAKQEPENRDARTRLVTAYLLAGRQPDAEKVLAAALKANPRDVDALLQRARISLGAGKPFDAQRDVEQVLRFQPASPLAHYLLAQVHRAGSHSEQYASELGEVLRFQPDLLGVRIELAQAQLAARQSKAAVALLDAAPTYQKQTLPYQVELNWVMLAEGNLAEAAKGVAQALKAERHAEILLQGGFVELQRRNYAAARTYLAESLERNPEDLRALEAMARTYAEQGQLPVAFQKLREHAARRPKSAAIQEYLGEQLQSQGNFAEARVAYNAAKAADPGFTRADLALAQVEMHDNRLDEARKRAAGAAAKDPVPAGLILGDIETKAGNYGAAVEQYRKVLAIAPRNVRALNNIAYLLLERQGRTDEALKYAQQAAEIVPDDASVQDTIGWAMYRKGVYGMAVEYLKRAANSNLVVAKYHLGVAYLKAGQVGTGRQVLDVAFKTDPNLPEAQLAKQALAEMPAGKK